MPTTATTQRKTAATKRSTAAKKAAATRAARKTPPVKPIAEPVVEQAVSSVDRVQQYAERAALVQLGASLAARDAVIEAVGTLRTSLTSRTAAEKELQARRSRLETELKRFERRGKTARTRVERDVKSTRTRLGKQIATTRRDVTAQADFATARVGNLVQTGRSAGQKVATTVQERIASVA